MKCKLCRNVVKSSNDIINHGVGKCKKRFKTKKLIDDEGYKYFPCPKCNGSGLEVGTGYQMSEFGECAVAIVDECRYCHCWKNPTKLSGRIMGNHYNYEI